MYRTSTSIRIAGAALAFVVGTGFVATAGGALRDGQIASERSQVMRLNTVVVSAHEPRVAAACEPKAAL